MRARDILVGRLDRAVLKLFGARERGRSPLAFFLLVLALSLPFWIIGDVIDIELLPGLPVSSLMFVCPAIAAAILVYRENETAGVAALLKRSFDYERIGAKVWYAPIVLLMPGAMVLAYGLMRLVGAPLPSAEFPAPAVVVAMFLAFLVAALGEELGWSGYATDPMQVRWGALRAGVLMGLVWAAYHYVPLVQADRSAAWIGWWCLYTVAIRVLIVWIYNNTGKSVFVAALFHATTNLTWQLFPNRGSHWDPAVTGPILALAAVIVTFLWGPKTLARFRLGSDRG